MKVQLPISISNEMNMWRRGYIGLPTSYIEFHQNLAQQDLNNNAAMRGWTIVSSKMINDGWGDGMKVLSAKIIDTDDKELSIKWHDGSQWWFVDTGHGHSRM